MYVNFEIAALFPSLYSRVKKAAISKETFIWTPSSRFLYYLSSSKRLTQVILGKIKAPFGYKYQRWFLNDVG